jgi:CheY-like chemotaxis protein
MPDLPCTILCVDDDPDDQQMLRYALLEANSGLQVVSAVNGIEALLYLHKAKVSGKLPSLVILDINMPLMDGKQTLADMRKDPDLQSIPVVFFTTSSFEKDERFSEQHRVQLMTKPTTILEYYDAVQKLLRICRC